MYVPDWASVDADAVRSHVEQVGSGWLVTNSGDGPPNATLLPVLWRGDAVIAHMAKANPHWRSIAEGDPGLLVVAGPEAYVSPSWYPSKAEHGRVVPTWNYVAVQLSGTLHLHTEPSWLLEAVRALTDRHESRRDEPWSVTDAPADFTSSKLRAIVGIEMVVDRVEGKAKLSQNRSAADRGGVIAGLRAEPDGRGAAAVAAAMEQRDAEAR